MIIIANVEIVNMLIQQKQMGINGLVHIINVMNTQMKSKNVGIITNVEAETRNAS